MQMHILPLSFTYNGKNDVLHAVVLQNNKESILIDCGYEGFMPLIEDGLNQKSLSLQDITGIIITHHDIDHMGALYEIKKKYPSIKVYSSAVEEGYISGREKSLRLVQAEQLYPSLPDEYKPDAFAFIELLKTMKPVDVDAVFSVDAEPDFFDRIQIIHTPGHMPGHVSVYVEESATLISADAMVIENGEFEIANPHFTLDLPAAIDSIKKIERFDIEKVVCYHGGATEIDIAGKLMRLISKYV